jgi:hypothetical protein
MQSQAASPQRRACGRRGGRSRAPPMMLVTLVGAWVCCAGGLARAQCTLPRDLPPNTQLVQPAGGEPDCAAGETINDGQQCTLACNPGQSQGPAGTYVYSCTGTTLSPVAPQCDVCPVNTYSDTPAHPPPCDSCPDGSSVLIPGAQSVAECQCDAGYIGDIQVPTDLCTACGIGQYQPARGSGSCIDCPDDSTTTDTGSTTMDQCLCEAGYSGDAATDGCDQCAAGQYSDSVGPDACVDCPANSGTAQPASTAVTECECDAGHTGTINAPDDECTACGVGTYKDAPGDAECTLCPADASTSGPGSTDVTDCDCDAGYSGVITDPSDECTECEIGQYLSAVQAASCIDCPDDSTTTDTGSTTMDQCLCEAGYSGDAATDGCDQCAVGQYSDSVGPDACVDCPANSGTAQPASTSVTECECEAGHTGTINAPDDECTACGVGTYKDAPGDAECTECPAHSGTDGNTGQVSVTACRCDAGFEGVVTSPTDQCSICLANTYKAGSGPGPCDGCPAYSVTLEEGATTVRQCECDLGHTGTITDPTDICVRCDFGSYKDIVGDEKCTTCPQHSTTEDLGASPHLLHCFPR